MNHSKLRELVEPVVARLSDYTHRQLGEACTGLGLPEPPLEGTKRERVNQSFDALPDAELPAVAERVLHDRFLTMNAATRNAIQDVLWADRGTPDIPKRTRRELARGLNLDDHVGSGERFMFLLENFWVLGDSELDWLFSGRMTGLRADIQQHVFRNPDWSTEYLFEQLGAFDSADTRFALFLEGLASADVIPDEPAQRRFVGSVNPHLRAVGIELRDTDNRHGYPVFSIVPTQSARNRRVRTLVFAALEQKPDIRFRDLIDNEIEVLEHQGKVLVYDRQIGGDGLRWCDLQAWWKETQQLASDDEAKVSLYQRLIGSLPGNSPPQRYLYELYHEIHGSAAPELPALLPEVWLHWDPKTIRQRGADALLNHRMDFLLLLPHGQRVVLEVDGAHHYTSPSGRPDSARYADNVRGDRELKLSGYEVFRFGGTELQNRDSAHVLLEAFFTDLFRRFNVTPRQD